MCLSLHALSSLVDHDLRLVVSRILALPVLAVAQSQEMTSCYRRESKTWKGFVDHNGSRLQPLTQARYPPF